MNYDQLKEVLPKPSICWTVADIYTWLSVIGHATLYPRFKKHSVDGSCIKSLNEQDLRSELNINSSWTVEKILLWVEKGLNEFDQLLEEKMKAQRSKKQQKKQREERDKKGSPLTETDHSNKTQQMNQQLILFNTVSKVYNSIQQKETIISSKQSCEISQPSKQYCPFDDYCLITAKQNKYYISPIENKQDVFIQVKKPIKLQQNMELEMGYFRFLISLYDYGICLHSFQLGKNIEFSSFPAEIEINPFTKTPSKRTCFGRPFLRIDYINGCFFIQSCSDEEEAWLRLNNQAFTIKQGTNFKLGRLGIKYSCNLVPIQKKDQMNSSPLSCIICTEKIKNCLFLDCRHLATCMKCGKMMTHCPICRGEVKDITRVYHG